MLVSDIMTRELLTASGQLTVAEGLALAREREVHHLLVVDSGRLKGVTCVCVLRDRPAREPLARSIARPPIVVLAQSTLKQAVLRFIETQVSCLPVCDGAQLVGVITRGDLRRSVVSEAMLPGRFRCTFCGSTRHVRPLRGDDALAACLACTDRMAPTELELYDEGVKG